MRRSFAATVGLFVVLAWCASAFALNPDLEISQYAHTSWRVRDGFAKGMILSIAQTPDGYLWLGTEFGLVRFDGVRAVPWQPPIGQQLPSDQIRSLLVARDGTLWIGTNRGLAAWKNGRLKTYPQLSELIYALLQDLNGTIWVGSIKLPSSGKLCSVQNDGLRCLGAESQFGPGVDGLFEDSHANLWVGVKSGFWRWQPGRPEFFPLPHESNGVYAFSEDDKGGLLMGTSNGLVRFSNGRLEAVLIQGLTRSFRPSRMLRDRDGGLWIATIDRGLLHLHQGKTDVFSQADGLSADYAYSLFEDREGNIWATTTNGIDRFRDYAVPAVTVKQGLSSGGAYSVLASKDDAVWIGMSGGLSHWKDGQISVIGSRASGAHAPGLLDGLPPESLFQDSRGRIWASTSREFGYLENDRFIPLREFPPGYVHGITEAGEGHLWVAHQQAGLFHVFQGKVVQHFPWAELGHQDFPYVILADPSQRGLWLGFDEGGVVLFADGKVQKSYATADGLGKGWVSGLRFDEPGTLWAATQGGLSRIKDGRIETLNSKNGLPCDAVHWSIEDDGHNVWLNMPCGLLRVTRVDLDAWALKPHSTVRTTHFDVSDGVPGYYSPGGYTRNVAKAHDGKLWFVAYDGVGIIDPHHLSFNKIPPPVHIERMVADGKGYDSSDRFRLPPHTRDVSIDYTALSLVVPEKVHFRYKLEGQDPDWREVVNVRQAHYSNLPPRHYTFRVIACNNSGLWNETGASLEFSIAPAYYQTTWFLVLCVAAFAGLLWALYLVRLRQIQRQLAAGMEERVGERLRIARELHDTLLQSFQGAVYQFQTARRLQLRKADNVLQVMDDAIDTAEQAITEGRAAIRDLRPEPVDHRTLAELLNTVGRELADTQELNGHSPHFRVIVEGKQQILPPILQDEVYRISREVVRNAFKHALATHIEVEIRYDEDQLRLRIRDDGKGIDPKILEAGGQAGHFGIPGIRERAQRIGSRLEFWSEMGAGTEVELAVPAAMAYPKRRDGRRFRLFRRAGGDGQRS